MVRIRGSRQAASFSFEIACQALFTCFQKLLSPAIIHIGIDLFFVAYLYNAFLSTDSFQKNPNFHFCAELTKSASFDLWNADAYFGFILSCFKTFKLIVLWKAHRSIFLIPFHFLLTSYKNILEISAKYSFKKAVYKAQEYARIKSYMDTIIKYFNPKVVFEKV